MWLRNARFIENTGLSADLWFHACQAAFFSDVGPLLFGGMQRLFKESSFSSHLSIVEMATGRSIDAHNSASVASGFSDNSWRTWAWRSGVKKPFCLKCVCSSRVRLGFSSSPCPPHSGHAISKRIGDALRADAHSRTPVMRLRTATGIALCQTSAS